MLRLPFTPEAFFAIFEAYNAWTWPLATVFFVFALLAVRVLPHPSVRNTRIVATVLAVMWGFAGIVYHGVFFSRINPAAYGFAALFVVQAALLVRVALQPGAVRFEARRSLRTLAGGTLIAYALFVYPLWGFAVGHVFPRAPMFGTAPCPLTLFTVGVLLLARPPGRLGLLVIPLLWAAIGSTAAFTLSVPQDLGLLVALGLGVALAPTWVRPKGRRVSPAG